MDLTRNVISVATLTASATNKPKWHTMIIHTNQPEQHTTHAHGKWLTQPRVPQTGERAAKLHVLTI